MTLADRYVFREILGPFTVALLTFVVLITGHILFTVVQVVIEHGVPLPNVAKFLALQVPRAVVLALPVATLLACALGLNRLATERELIALRAAGASLARILRPALLLGTAAVIASFVVSEAVVPWANRSAQRMLHQIVLTDRAMVFRPGKFTEAGPQLHFFVEQVDRRSNLLQGVFFFFNQANDFPILFAAKRARFSAEGLTAEDARFYHLGKDANLTWGPMRGAAVNVSRFLTGPPAQFTTVETMSFLALLREWRGREPQVPAHGRRYAVEIHWRLALAFSCLAFALLAGAMAQHFAGSQQLAGVLVSLLAVFAYYVLMLWLRMLGDSGVVSPLISGWLLNGLLVVVCGSVIWRQR